MKHRVGAICEISPLLMCFVSGGECICLASADKIDNLEISNINNLTRCHVACCSCEYSCVYEGYKYDGTVYLCNDNAEYKTGFEIILDDGCRLRRRKGFRVLESSW